jgi:hypothetical protein
MEKPMVAVTASALVSAAFRNEPKRPPVAGSDGQRAAKLAYEQGRVGPADLDGVEIHGAFSLPNSRGMKNWDYVGIVREYA